jgi:hypothetical protein
MGNNVEFLESIKTLFEAVGGQAGVMAFISIWLKMTWVVINKTLLLLSVSGMRES